MNGIRRTGTLYQRLAVLGLALVLNTVAGSCKKEARQTRVYGQVVDAFTKEPIAGVEILIQAYPRESLTRGDVLQTLLTDSQGKYSILMEPPKKYYTLQLINRYFEDSKLSALYKGYYAYFNGQQIAHCCPVRVGEKAEFNFSLIPQ